MYWWYSRKVPEKHRDELSESVKRYETEKGEVEVPMDVLVDSRRRADSKLVDYVDADMGRRCRWDAVTSKLYSGQA